jgi:hypothetical protein
MRDAVHLLWSCVTLILILIVWDCPWMWASPAVGSDTRRSRLLFSESAGAPPLSNRRNQHHVMGVNSPIG